VPSVPACDVDILFFSLLFCRYFEVIVIFKKMMLTGAMVLIAPGSPLQLLVAIFIILFYLLLILKIAPFVDEADDWLSFLCSFQMLVTLLAGFALLTDTKENKTFPSQSMGPMLIALNSLAFFALVASIALLMPGCRERVNRTGGNNNDATNAVKVMPLPALDETNFPSDLTTGERTDEITGEEKSLRSWGRE